MSKDTNKPITTPPIDPLEQQVAELKQQVADLQAANEVMAEQLDQLKPKSSVSFEEPPVGELGFGEPFDLNGVTVRFKIKKFVYQTQTLLAQEVATDPTLRVEVATFAPGLVEEV